jgi:eukaryotic-like serine/threonine-protein kinase
MALSPGSKLGAYEIVGLIGVGGMGEVYKATNTKFGRRIVEIRGTPDVR